MTDTAIIGTGELGQALITLLNERAPATWDVRDGTPETLRAAVGSARVIFFAIPTRALPSALVAVAADAPADAIFVLLSKGLTPDGRTSVEVAQEVIAGRALAVLGGPMLAEELRVGKPGFAALAARSESIAHTVQEIFHGTALAITLQGTPEAVALAGVLKNVYAIGLGILEALDPALNLRGAYVAAALSEMRGLFQALNHDPIVLEGCAGVGDFIATGFSHSSLNQTIGQELARQGRTTREGEGLLALSLLGARIGNTPAPLFETLRQIATGVLPAADLVSSLTARD